MREIGDDAGTFLRLIFHFETPENLARIKKAREDALAEIMDGAVDKKKKRHH